MLERIRKWLPFKRGDQSARRVAGDDGRGPQTMHREFESLFDRIGAPSAFPSILDGGSMDTWFGDFSPARFMPCLDVADKGTQLEISVELPGMEAGDVDIDVHEGSLVITGEKRFEQTHEEEGCYRTERSYGAFRRVVPLPPDTDAESAEATFTKGVLTIQVPKAMYEDAPRKIEIQAT